MKKLLASASVLTMIITMNLVAPSLSQAAIFGSNATSLIQPYTSQGCSGNTCIYLSTPSGGKLLVEGWAYASNFYGYFRLTTPSVTYYSATQTWLRGKGNYASWPGLTAVVGQYCVTGYTSTGTFEGTACENVL